MPHCANCAKHCARHLHASQTGKKKIQTKKTIMPGVRFQMQADLVDFSLLKSYNDNYKYRHAPLLGQFRPMPMSIFDLESPDLDEMYGSLLSLK